MNEINNLIEKIKRFEDLDKKIRKSKINSLLDGKKFLDLETITEHKKLSSEIKNNRFSCNGFINGKITLEEAIIFEKTLKKEKLERYQLGDVLRREINKTIKTNKKISFKKTLHKNIIIFLVISFLFTSLMILLTNQIPESILFSIGAITTLLFLPMGIHLVFKHHKYDMSLVKDYNLDDIDLLKKKEKKSFKPDFIY